MKEAWKDIPEYEGLYQVSNLGRIKSLERIKTYEMFNQYGSYGIKSSLQKELSAMFNVCQRNIRFILNNKTWSHI